MSKNITNYKLQITNKYQILKLKKVWSLRFGDWNFQSKSYGFTLVELLVVIAVITMIIVVVFPNFMGVRQRARDTQRKNDMREMQKAMELHKSDQIPPAYPSSGAFASSDCGQCWSSGVDCTGNIYMRKLPCEPGSNSANSYFYERNVSDDLSYTLTACLENIVDTERDPTPHPTCAASGTSYTVNEP